MTIELSGEQIASKIAERFPDSVVTSNQNSVEVKPESLLQVATFLKTSPDFACDYLTSVTAVDYQDYFELIYQLTSLQHNHSLILKTRLYNRNEAVISSVINLWRGADFQEREIRDLFGIKFDGHPNLKPIFLWEGFKGYPLRKDYLEWQ